MNTSSLAGTWRERTIPAWRAGWTTASLVGLFVTTVYVAVSVSASLLPLQDPLIQDLSHVLEAPSARHLIGTDALGRDVLSRLVWAAQRDLALAVGSTLLALLIGSAVGLVAGFYRGVTDMLTGRLIDLFLSIPTYPLLVLLLFALGPGTTSVIVAFAVTGWIGYARLMRSQVLVIRGLDYVLAAELGGLGRRSVIVRHVLPNAWRQSLTLWCSDVVLSIGVIAALGFLGIGIQPPTPEWGVMLQEGQVYMFSNWWLTIPPGLAIVVFGCGVSLLSTRAMARAS